MPTMPPGTLRWFSPLRRVLFLLLRWSSPLCAECSFSPQNSENSVRLRGILWEKQGGMRREGVRVNVVVSAPMMRVLSPFFGRNRGKPAGKRASRSPRCWVISAISHRFCPVGVCSSLPGYTLILPKVGPEEVRTIPGSVKPSESQETSRK